MSASSQAKTGLAPNYLYWQENGAQWVGEYSERRLHQPKYLLQEILLSSHVTRAAPIKVLEFGCGVGRHLRYLSTISGVDAHGVDQSPTMMAGIELWAAPEWMSSHVTRIDPVGALPFRDGEFDLVFTSEVLVHVRPEDLPNILSELRRVSRGQVLHFEPVPGDQLHSGAHGGCWSHDLSAVWNTLGEKCEGLGPFCADQAVFWVPLKSAAPVPFSTETLERTRLLEQVLSSSAGETQRQTISDLRRDLDARDVSLTAARGFIDLLIKRDATAERERADLRRVRTAMQHTATQVGGESLRPLKGRSAVVPEIGLLATRLDELENERRLLASSWSHRAGRRVFRALSHLPGVSTVSRLVGRPTVRIEVLPQRDARSKGNEVWLLQARFGDDGTPYPLNLASFDPSCASLREEPGVPYSRALVANKATSIDLPVHPHQGRLTFLRHNWSGRVAINARGRTQIVDLYSATPDALEVDLGAWPFALRRGDARRT